MTERFTPVFKFLLLALLTLQIVSASAGAGTINVFLVGGQSNADGRGDSAELPDALKAQKDVLFFSNTAGLKLTFLQPWTSPSAGVYQFGPEIAFGRSLAEFHGAKDEKVALLKFARGGTNLFEDWKADGTGGSSGDGKTYQEFQMIMHRGLAALKAGNPGDAILIRGMIWMQGEGDTETKRNQAASGKYSLDYAANLTLFIRDVRATFGSELLFVIGQLSDNQKGTGPDIYRNNVRAGQEQVAKDVPSTGLVRTDSFALKPDRVHFNASGQQSLGIGFADEMRRLLRKQ